MPGLMTVQLSAQFAFFASFFALQQAQQFDDFASFFALQQAQQPPSQQVGEAAGAALEAPAQQASLALKLGQLAQFLAASAPVFALSRQHSFGHCAQAAFKPTASTSARPSLPGM